MTVKKSENLLKSKFLFTIMIALAYLLGKGLPLYMVNVGAYMSPQLDAEDLLVQTIRGDINQCSLFALGISPYMIASILVQMLLAFRSPEAKKRTSPSKVKKWTLGFMLAFSVIMAVERVQELQFRVAGPELIFVKAVAALEMIAGAVLILHMISRIQKYGVGGQSVLIFMNIVDGILVTIRGKDWSALQMPLLISALVMLVTIVMENTEKRIPVQRISIHNIYADKNYLAIKLNPIGVMPAMFTTAVFMLPQLLLTALNLLLPENAGVLWLKENMTLSSYVGVSVYIMILWALTIGFTRIMIHPGELTEQFLKSGDSIRDLHAGRDTKKYLSGVVTRLGFCSAFVMSVCLCVPMVLQIEGVWDGALITLPSSVMMLTGIWCSLYREVMAVRDLEAYKPFV